MRLSAALSLSILIYAGFCQSCTSANPGFYPGATCEAGGTQCGNGLKCDKTRHVCVCLTGSTTCGAACVDTTKAAAHCGGCDLACPAGDTCAAGRCSSGACAGRAIECSGICVDPQTNAQSCGGCTYGQNATGKQCGDGETCVAGVCTKPACPFGATLCAGACADLSSSPRNCGKCGAACSANMVCSEGACRASCSPGLTRCQSACVDLRSDPTNCGSCGVACDNGEVCARDKGKVKCQEFKYSGCAACPCPACGDERSCCVLAAPSGTYVVTCIDGACPASAK